MQAPEVHVLPQKRLAKNPSHSPTNRPGLTLPPSLTLPKNSLKNPTACPAHEIPGLPHLTPFFLKGSTCVNHSVAQSSGDMLL